MRYYSKTDIADEYKVDKALLFKVLGHSKKDIYSENEVKTIIQKYLTELSDMIVKYTQLKEHTKNIYNKIYRD